MKIGVVLPQTEIGNDPGAIKAYAEAVEDMGFTHILVFDHVLGALPGGRRAERLLTSSAPRAIFSRTRGRALGSPPAQEER